MPHSTFIGTRPGLLTTGFVGRKTIRCGRPLGPIAVAILTELRNKGPMTARELAQACMIRCRAAEYTCGRLLGADLIRIKDRVAVLGSHKRVGRYIAVDPAVVPTSFVSIFP
jgi:hypothetical protein